MIKYDLLGSCDLDPESRGKPMNSWCVSVETECSDEDFVH